MTVSTLLVFLFLANPAPAGPATNALDFLKKATQPYSDATSYYLEAQKETTRTNELSRSWEKSLLIASIAPGQRYRFEGRSGFGAAVVVSDGRTKWDYRVHEGIYTETTATTERTRYVPQEEMPVMEAKNLIVEIRMLALHAKNAAFLPEENLTIDGVMIPCRVVRFENVRNSSDSESKFETTVWLDKSRYWVRKILTRGETFIILPDSKAHIPIFIEEITIFQAVKLDEQESPETFRFTPPATAKRVASFPKPEFVIPGNPESDLVGKPVPDVHLKREGEEVTLSSFRGRPVFIEFWATWCGACLDLTDPLKDLYRQTAPAGLVWISIDEDDDAKIASEYTERVQIPWPNYHDTNKVLGKMFGVNGLPVGVLIDANGTGTFYEAGYDVSQLRAAIAKLGPEFSKILNAERP